MDNQMDKLGAVIEIMNNRRRNEIERLQQEVASTGVPMSSHLVQQISQLNPNDVREVLMDHPGYLSWEALKSYEISVNVFHQAFDDLEFAIDKFVDRAREGAIFDRPHQTELDRIERKVQKELFAAANAAHSLVDHSTRRLQDRLAVADYEIRMKESFQGDGLHDFIIDLRTIIHHIRMQPANWNVRIDFKAEPEINAAFQLDKATLRLASQKMNAGGRSYLESADSKIDVQEVFKEYRRRATAFHDWFAKAIESGPQPDLRDYERCLDENKKMASRTIWKAMIGNWLNWEQPPNPYDYLGRYLTADQLNVVESIPAKSTEQVDQIIEFVDAGFVWMTNLGN